jgi:uncharacterized UBP type Zn finger protein
MAVKVCIHIDAVTEIKQPQRRVCEECVKTGDSWVHLRTCQQCGTTRCCDSSPNRHATKHARASGHPVIASAELSERWLYCYPDDAFSEYYPQPQRSTEGTKRNPGSEFLFVPSVLFCG